MNRPATLAARITQYDRQNLAVALQIIVDHDYTPGCLALLWAERVLQRLAGDERRAA